MPFDLSPSDPTTVEEDEVARVLVRAADVIRERGWCQNALEKNGAVCAVGALAVAEFGDVDACGLSGYGPLFRHVGGSVAEWNNARGRTASEVISAFENAALHRARALQKMGE